MSLEAFQLALKMRDIGRGQKFVLLTLAHFSNPRKGHVSWHSQATIASACGMGERTVRRHLAALEAAGLIRRRARYGGGSRLSDLITMAFIPANLAALKEVHTGQKLPFIPANLAGEPKIELKEERGARETGRGETTPSPAEWQATSRRLTGGEREAVRAMALDLARQLGAKASDAPTPPLAASAGAAPPR